MLTDAHAEYLMANAIDPGVAESHGVESVEGGLVFPYRNPSGRTVNVFRPDDPGDGPKYRSPSGEYPGLNVIIPGPDWIGNEGDRLLLIEGTKQALAAASWTPPGYMVVGMNGAWGWKRRVDGESQVIPDLDIVEGKHVVLSFDADFNTNSDVHAAGEKLARECYERGALSVRRMETGGEGSEGLDDLLARLNDAWRTWQLGDWIMDAQSMPRNGEPELPYIDIKALLKETPPDDPWLFDGIFAQGFGHVVYAPYANQKSLFTLWACVDMIRSRNDVHVLYLDYEMNRNLLRDRLESMGFTPDSPETEEINDRLHYWLIPDLPPLDTMEGGSVLEEHVKNLMGPGRELVVVIDTTIRAVEGDENASNTIGNFSRFTAKPLNALGVTWIRVDHAGKAKDRGQRGSSAKGDDVALIWKISMSGEGVDLTIEKDRAGYTGGRRITSFKRTLEPLRFDMVEYKTPEKVLVLVQKMDAAGLPDDIGRDKARAALPDVIAGSETWAPALRIRKQRAQEQ